MAYIGILSNDGKVVEKEDAFDYAIEQVTNNEEEKQEFIEWFFSGNWIEKENEEDY